MFRKNLSSKLVCLSLIVALTITIFTGCGILHNTAVNNKAPASRIVVDHAGRSVHIPGVINKVFSTSPVGTILTYTLAPERNIAWNHEIPLTYQKFILPQYRNLPDLGGWYASKTCNTEELLKIHPDVILAIGDVNQNTVSMADRVQQQLGIPVVIVNSELDRLDRAYEFLGDLLGVTNRAGELAAYCRKTVNEVSEKAKLIPEEKRIRVYYAEGEQGLETDPKGSRHTEVLDLVGGINVANVPLKGGMGLTSVSVEQILWWDPDVILTATMGPLGGKEGRLHKYIMTNPKWLELKAVHDQRVYDIPDKPFNWFDRPPSVNRIIGVKWLANLLYPDVFTYDINAETKAFYAKFYHYSLSDQEVEDILARAGMATEQISYEK